MRIQNQKYGDKFNLMKNLSKEVERGLQQQLAKIDLSKESIDRELLRDEERSHIEID